MSAAPPTSVTHNAVLGELHETLGVFLLGYVTNMVLYGFTSYQLYIYFTHLAGETTIRKCTIGLLGLLDVASVALLTQTLHKYIIVDFIQTVPVVHIATSGFITDNLLAVISIFICQIAYAVTVHKKTQRSTQTVLIALSAVAALVLGIVMSIRLYSTPNFDLVDTPISKTVITTGQGLTVLGSLITFVVLHTVTPSTTKDTFVHYWDFMIEVGVERGLLATVFQLAYFITFISAPTSRYWLAFQLFVRRLYFVGIITFYINENARTKGPDSGRNDTSLGTSGITQPSSHAVNMKGGKNTDLTQTGSHYNDDKVFRITRTVEQETF